MIILYLIVVCIENYRQLDRFDILFVDAILLNAQLFDTEVLFESIANESSTSFVDWTVEKIELNQGLVT